MFNPTSTSVVSVKIGRTRTKLDHFIPLCQIS